ncbi:MAG: class I SAM-dependent methyltransferase [Acidimicrobiia bacterium]
MASLNLEQARRQAKELLAAAHAGDPAALARVRRPQLADAQYAVAKELGFASWPQLVAALGDEPVFAPAHYDDVEWASIERVTIVPFLDDGRLVLPEDSLIHGRVRDGEHALVDSVLRIPMERAGYRRQGTHVLGVSDVHVAFWVDGARYRGTRGHRRDAQWWTGTAAEGATILREQGKPNSAALVEMADDARVNLSESQYSEDMQRVLDAAYLTADTPQGGSGFGGTADDWRLARSVLCDAIERDGTFLDVGCANGLLMETIVEWCAGKGVRVEPYGVDISEGLAARARARLPQWADRIWVGNARTWTPPDGMRFDVVHTLLEVVPDACHGDLVAHLLDAAVAPGGRLLLSWYNPSDDPEHTPAARIRALGYAVGGETSVPDRPGRSDGTASAWINKP